MIKKYYEKINETLYTEELDNGLKVFYLPKTDYHKVYGIFTTNFGSLDISFDGATYPAGIAHFLEHKLFEKPEGDVMLKFGEQGAQTNAFTSFNKTAYLFEGSENIKKNIELLLDFVQEPYFTEASVAKEQGIITQEIQMYQDDPDWRLYAGTLAALYPDSPLAEDIAGTPESIAEISPEMLYQNYQTFYQPSNMSLFLTGNFNIDEISDLVHQNQAQKKFVQSEIKRAPLEFAPAVSFTESSMEVSENKLAVGLRSNHQVAEEEFFEYRLALRIYFALLFGKTSDFYEESYQGGLIDDSFSYELELSPEFQAIIVSLDTSEPEKLAKILQERLNYYRIKGDISDKDFELVKRQFLGAYFTSLNSLEAVANQFVALSREKELTYFDSSEILEKLDKEKVIAHAESFLKNSETTEYIIRRKDKK